MEAKKIPYRCPESNSGRLARSHHTAAWAITWSEYRMIWIFPVVRKCQEAECCVMRSFIICTIHKILVLSSQGEWYGMDM